VFRFSILCVFCLGLEYFVLVLFAFVVLDLVSSVLCQEPLAGKNVSEMTCFVSSGTYKNSSGDEIANVNFCTTTTYM